MADKRTGNFAAADAGAEQSDPFAELTRIMGFDPRQNQAGQDASANDLEDELVRELDSAEHVETPEAYTQGEPTQVEDDLPVIHLSHPDADAPVSRTAEDGYRLEDEEVRELEDEFNALLGNSSAPEAELHAAPGWNDQTAYAEDEPAFDEPEADDARWASAAPVQASAAPAPAQPEAPQPVASDDPFAMLAAMAEKYKLQAADEVRAPEPAPRPQPVPAPAPSSYAAPAQSSYAAAPVQQQPAPRVTAAPEIETVEVNDRAVAIADDLDLPNLPVVEEPQPAAAYDDIDAEFNNLLNQMSSHEPLQPTRPAYQPAAAARPTPEPVQPVARATPAAAPQPAEDIRLSLSDEDLAGAFDDIDDLGDDAGRPYAAQDDRYANDEEFDLGDGFADDDLPVAAYEEAAAERPRRGLLVAAIIGGIALLGVAGAIAMSMMGSAQGGAPALVKSDHSPIKVRPANPGGVAVPNQNSSVYETVANRQTGSQPQQDKLVNAAEEPIELADELPDNTDEDVAEADEPKSEDRIEQIAAQVEPEAQDTIAVAPRKVRTVVVKPDGTLAPAEEPAKPEAAAKPAEAQAAAKPEAKKKEAAPAPQAAAEETPASVAQDQTTASIEAQPAPTGAWATQIASETSEEAAQAAYKKLASRYPSLLDGKGVSIVKAEIAGKGTRWRVRILSESRNDAAGLCSSLKSAGGSCFVSKS